MASKMEPKSMKNRFREALGHCIEHMRGKNIKKKKQNLGPSHFDVLFEHQVMSRLFGAFYKKSSTHALKMIPKFSLSKNALNKFDFKKCFQTFC